MIVVHHLQNSRSQRVLWLLEELQLRYQVVIHRRDPRTWLAPEALRAVHPLGKSPVLVDDGEVLAESGAIIEYLCERYDGEQRLLPPAASPQRQRVRYWLHYAEGSAMPPLLMAVVFARIRTTRMPFFARPVARAIVDKAMRGFVLPQLRVHLDWMEQQLGQHAWFAGDQFSAADIQLSFPIQAAAVRGDGLERHPRLQAFLQRVEQRPAYQAALQSGGAFELLSGLSTH